MIGTKLQKNKSVKLEVMNESSNLTVNYRWKFIIILWKFAFEIGHRSLQKTQVGSHKIQQSSERILEQLGELSGNKTFFILIFIRGNWKKLKRN